MYPISFVLPKETGIPPKKSAFLPALGALEPYVGGSGDVVIPKQDTLLCIADRSLSRLRGSPLPGAGCWGPVTCVGAFILLYADVQVLSFASARLFCRVLLRRLCRRGALGWLCRLSLGGRLALVLRWRVCPAGCCCGGFAAGALLGWLCRLGLGGHLAAWIGCGYAGYRCSFSPYKQSPPL